MEDEGRNAICCGMGQTAAQNVVEKYQGIPEPLVQLAARKSGYTDLVLDAWRTYERLGNKAATFRELAERWDNVPMERTVFRWLRVGEGSEDERTTVASKLLDEMDASRIATEIAIDGSNPPSVRLQAIESEAKRRGWNAPEQSINLTLTQRLGKMSPSQRQHELIKRAMQLRTLAATTPEIEEALQAVGIEAEAATNVAPQGPGQGDSMAGGGPVPPRGASNSLQGPQIPPSQFSQVGTCTTEAAG